MLYLNKLEWMSRYILTDLNFCTVLSGRVINDSPKLEF